MGRPNIIDRNYDRLCSACGSRYGIHFVYGAREQQVAYCPTGPHTMDKLKLFVDSKKYRYSICDKRNNPHLY